MPKVAHTGKRESSYNTKTHYKFHSKIIITLKEGRYKLYYMQHIFLSNVVWDSYLFFFFLFFFLETSIHMGGELVAVPHFWTPWLGKKIIYFLFCPP